MCVELKSVLTGEGVTNAMDLRCFGTRAHVAV